MEPLDYLILTVLPPEGALVLNAYPDGRTAKQISDEAFEGKISTRALGPRMGVLGTRELVRRTRGIGTAGDAIYQITPAGKAVLLAWQQKQKEASTTTKEMGDGPR